MRARKPPPEIDPDDSDPDDEFQVVPVSVPPPLPSYDGMSGPAKIFRAQEERKTQEAVLGRIFDVEPYLVKRPARRTKEKENEAPKQEHNVAPASDFINSLKAVSGKLMKELNGSDDFTAAQQEILDTIEAAARKYVSEESTKTDNSQKHEGNGESSTSKVHGEETHTAGASDDQEAEPSLFEDQGPKSKEAEQGSSPDDIDIEAPVEDSFAEDLTEVEAVNNSDDATTAEAPSAAAEPATKANGANAAVEIDNDARDDTSSGISKADVNLDAQRANFKTLGEKLRFYEIEAGQLQKEINSMDVKAGPDAMKQFKEAERQINSFSDNIKDIKHEMAVVAAELEDAEKQKPDGSDIEGAGVRQRVSEYTRSTRGLSLHMLSIHLIPVKASVLSKAIDLRCLKKLTLLNVGNQAPIWALLAKENKAQPLPLRKIFTDNVSIVFLTFVSQLSELHELYMLERPEKYKPESFAPKSTVTIDQIRRFALRKHQDTLVRLMIKNQNDMSWDLDKKTTLLLTRFRKLEELAISMSIREIVSFAFATTLKMQLLTYLPAHVVAANPSHGQSASTPHCQPKK